MERWLPHASLMIELMEMGFLEWGSAVNGNRGRDLVVGGRSAANAI